MSVSLLASMHCTSVEELPMLGHHLEMEYNVMLQ